MTPISIGTLLRKENLYAIDRICVILLLLPLVTTILYADLTRTSDTRGDHIQCLAQSAGYLFAGTWGAGIYRSSDNGVTWTPSNTGLLVSTIYGLGATPGWVFAGTESGGGVYRSSDNGGTCNWQRRGCLPTWWSIDLPRWKIPEERISSSPHTTQCIAQQTTAQAGPLPEQGPLPFVQSVPWGIRSSPAGRRGSIVRRISELPGSARTPGWQTITFLHSRRPDPRFTQRFTAEESTSPRTADSSGPRPVWGTEICGRLRRQTAWCTRANPKEESTERPMAGAAWTSLGPSGMTVSALLADGSGVFAGTWAGIYPSTNAGTSWQPVLLSSPRTLSIVGTSRIYASGYGGVNTTTDGGTTWTFSGSLIG